MWGALSSLQPCAGCFPELDVWGLISQVQLGARIEFPAEGVAAPAVAFVRRLCRVLSVPL